MRRSLLRPVRPLRSLAVAGLLMLGLAGSALAAHPIYRAEREGPALRGYDTVAYFTEGRAVLGSEEHEVVWRDTLWRFASAAHKALFEKDPEKYAPQFGGYCAYAASRNRLYEGHPEIFAIEDGKLYFNNNAKVMERWLAEPEPYIEAAKEAFPAMISGELETPAAPQSRP
ncbi:MAG: YHS domain-containing (seleno)protein [Myxococcota bacterium]